MGCCTCSSPHATAGVTVIELGAESDADLLAYEEFLTVVCCALGKLCSSRTLSTCMCAPTVCPDLVFGKGMSPVATLAGRSTRYLMLVGLPGGNHQAALPGAGDLAEEGSDVKGSDVKGRAPASACGSSGATRTPRPCPGWRPGRQLRCRRPGRRARAP